MKLKPVSTFLGEDQSEVWVMRQIGLLQCLATFLIFFNAVLLYSSASISTPFAINLLTFPLGEAEYEPDALISYSSGLPFGLSTF